MTEQEKLRITWQDFNTNLSSGVHESLNCGNFLDVTLMAEGQFIRAHRLILSVSSRYFQQILTQISFNKEAFLFLKDVKFDILNEIVQYIYSGEVRIKEEQLSDFISTAEALQIKGFDQEKLSQRKEIKQKCQKTQYSSRKIDTHSTSCLGHTQTPIISPLTPRTTQDQNQNFVTPVGNKDRRRTTSLANKPVRSIPCHVSNLEYPRSINSTEDILETRDITLSDSNCTNLQQVRVQDEVNMHNASCNEAASLSTSFFLEPKDGDPITLSVTLEDSENQMNSDAEETIRSFPFSVINEQLRVSSYAESFLGSPAPKPHAPIQTGLSKRVPKFLQNRTQDDWHSIKYQTTERGNILNFEGQRFVKKGSYGSSVYWTCAKRNSNCKVRAKTSNTNPKVCEIRGVHNHPIIS